MDAIHELNGMFPDPRMPKGFINHKDFWEGVLQIRQRESMHDSAEELLGDLFKGLPVKSVVDWFEGYGVDLVMVHSIIDSIESMSRGIDAKYPQQLLNRPDTWPKMSKKVPERPYFARMGSPVFWRMYKKLRKEIWQKGLGVIMLEEMLDGAYKYTPAHAHMLLEAGIDVQECLMLLLTCVSLATVAPSILPHIISGEGEKNTTVDRWYRPSVKR